MPQISRLVIKNKRLKPLISFALQEGWSVKLTAKGNVQLKKKGCANIYNAAYLIERERRRYTLEKNTNNEERVWKK